MVGALTNANICRTYQCYGIMTRDSTDLISNIISTAAPMQNAEGTEDEDGASTPLNPPVSGRGSRGGGIHSGTMGGYMTENNNDYSASKGEESATGEYRSALWTCLAR